MSSFALEWFRPSRGLAADVPAWEVGPDFWTLARNVFFRDAFAERIKGERSAYATVQTNVLNLLNAIIGGTNFWIYHGTNKQYAVNGVTHTDITRVAISAQSAAHKWTSGLLNGVPVANNQIDPPMYWDGQIAHKFVDLPGWPANTSCGAIVPHNFHLFALNITDVAGNRPMSLLWSGLAPAGTIPTTWTAAANNEAGGGDCASTPGPILGGGTLGQALMIYKRSATHAADYVQFPKAYTLRTVIPNGGILTARAFCDISSRQGSAHFLVGDGECVIFDGVGRRDVAQGRLARFIFNALDVPNYEMLFCVFNRAKGEVWICFPTAGQTFCNLAAVYHIAADTWGVRDLTAVSCAARGVVNDTAPADSWDSDSGTWDSDTSLWDAQTFSLAREDLLLGVPGTPAIIDTDQADNTTPTAIVGKYDMTFGAAERIKTVKALHLLADPGFGTIYARVGSRMTTSAPIQWSAEFAITEPASIAPLFAKGRFISAELRSAGVNTWRISGFGLDTKMGGLH